MWFDDQYSFFCSKVGVEKTVGDGTSSRERVNIYIPYARSGSFLGGLLVGFDSSFPIPLFDPLPCEELTANTGGLDLLA